MNFRQYVESDYDLYSEFSATVRKIVRISLENSEGASRIQAMQCRAKAPQSLRKKLEMRGLLDSDDIENQIKDIAGCRLIFYTNNDVNAFLSSRLIIENFLVDWDKSKVHQPIGDTDQGYVATHYVVSLTEERLKLPEYEKFRGLECEIQVQSILNHAWAETSHDIVYKRPTLEGFGSKEFQSIERRMQEIMTKYLLPAGYEFQKIEQDFEKLLTGKKLFEEGGLDKLNSCHTNNERCDILDRFRDYVLPQYDDVVAAFPGIRSQLVDTVCAARTTETAVIETPFGVMPGKSYEQVTEIALGILERLRYVNVDEVFSSLCELYLGRKSDSEGEKILSSVEKLAGHNLEIWKQAGPYVQSRICERIEGLNDDELERLVPLAARALSQVLSAEAESTSSTYSTVTFHRAAIQASEALAEVRQTAIDLCKKMYSSTMPERHRRLVLSALWQATDIPRLGRSSEELDLMILANSTKVLEFYLEIAKDESFELLQHLEQQSYWLFKRYAEWSQENTEHKERSVASRDLRKAILAFRDRINEDNEYQIYKTLVGYESVFLPEWEDPDFDHRAQDKFRKERISELLESVNTENVEVWKKRIIRCASTESIDGATFPYFGHFLNALARTKPGIVIGWLEDLDERLSHFLPSILPGLQQSDAKATADEIVGHWIDDNRYLPLIARALRFSENPDPDTLEKIVDAAKIADDSVSLINVIATIFDKCTPENFETLGTLGLASILHCTGLRENRWIHEAWIYANKSVFLENLDQDQVKVVLENIQTANKIDYHSEQLLANVALRYPSLVIDFFGDRLRRDRNEAPDSLFEAIPFSFHELDSILCKHPDLVIELSRKLFDEDDYLFEFRGGRLIRITFPDFTDELEVALIDQATNGGDAGVDFVLHILRNYEGDVFLHDVVKNVICVLNEDDKRLGLLEMALDSTGVVSGEFGMRDAYLRKKEEVAPWLTADNEKLRLFAERYSRTLDRQIAAEHRRAQEDIEMRKREYGETGTENGE